MHWLDEWIKTSDNYVSPESSVMGFNKCCLSNDTKWTKHDFLWEEDHEKNCASSDESVGSEYFTIWCQN